MLVYHPAFDIYHGVLRILKLLISLPQEEVEIEKLKILNFYFLFPELISQIRLSRTHQKYKKLSTTGNKYNVASVSGQEKQVFVRIEPFNEIILAYLETKNYIKIHEIYLEFFATKLPKETFELCKIKDDEKELIDFLSKVLASYQIRGTDGLKARTGLLEFKYDDV
ncbi:MAG TPA: hypothetical protein DCP47_06935 [Phycisphaerales bacterium]|nr:hypothetical protein [Phycisphaerales bacterium]